MCVRHLVPASNSLAWLYEILPSHVRKKAQRWTRGDLKEPGQKVLKMDAGLQISIPKQGLREWLGDRMTLASQQSPA